MKFESLNDAQIAYDKLEMQQRVTSAQLKRVEEQRDTAFDWYAGEFGGSVVEEIMMSNLELIVIEKRILRGKSYENRKVETKDHAVPKGLSGRERGVHSGNSGRSVHILGPDRELQSEGSWASYEEVGPG